MEVPRSAHVGAEDTPRQRYCASGYQECQLVRDEQPGWQIGPNQTRRSQRFQSSQRRHALDPDRYAVLRKPRGVEGPALRRQERHLERWLRTLRDGCPETAVHRRRHVVVVPEGDQGPILTGAWSLFARLPGRHQKHASGGSSRQADLLPDIEDALTPEVPPRTNEDASETKSTVLISQGQHVEHDSHPFRAIEGYQEATSEAKLRARLDVEQVKHRQQGE